MKLVVGDIHGCFRTFSRLLGQVGWCAGKDELWCVGDLVSKGAGSLGVLRWMTRHQASVRAVLGNHDLYLLARAAGVCAPKRSDRLDEMLAAPDRTRLLEWLSRCPLVYRDGSAVLVHAGLWPTWSVDEAERLGECITDVLRGPGMTRLLERLGRLSSVAWTERLTGLGQLAAAAAILTQIRVAEPSGSAALTFTGQLEQVPRGSRPWFDLSPVVGARSTVVFGHWARLGRASGPGWYCLDSGCVYGGALSGLILESGEVVTEPVDPADTAPV